MQKNVTLMLVMAQGDYRRGRDQNGQVILHPAGPSFYEIAEHRLTAKEQMILAAIMPHFRPSVIVKRADLKLFNRKPDPKQPGRLAAEIITRAIEIPDAADQKMTDLVSAWNAMDWNEIQRIAALNDINSVGMKKTEVIAALIEKNVAVPE